MQEVAKSIRNFNKAELYGAVGCFGKDHSVDKEACLEIMAMMDIVWDRDKDN